MILDNLLLFTGTSNGTGGPTAGPYTDSVAQVAGTYTCSHIIDLGLNSGIPASAAGGGARDIGIGDNPAMKLLIRMTTTVTSGGAATLQFIFAGAPDNGSGVAGSYTSMWTSPAYTVAQCAAGQDLANIDIPRPVPNQVIPRFLRLQFIVATATITAGAVEAGIVIDRDDQPYPAGTLSGYPAGIVIAN